MSSEAPALACVGDTGILGNVDDIHLQHAEHEKNAVLDSVSSHSNINENYTETDHAVNSFRLPTCQPTSSGVDGIRCEAEQEKEGVYNHSHFNCDEVCGCEIVRKCTDSSTTTTTTTNSSRSNNSAHNQNETTNISHSTIRRMRDGINNGKDETNFKFSGEVVIHDHDIWKRFLHELRSPHPSTWFRPVDNDFFHYYSFGDANEDNEHSRGDGPTMYGKQELQLDAVTSSRVIDVVESFAPSTLPSFFFDRAFPNDVKVSTNMIADDDLHNDEVQQQNDIEKNIGTEDADGCAVIASSDDEDYDNDHHDRHEICANVYDNRLFQSKKKLKNFTEELDEPCFRKRFSLRQDNNNTYSSMQILAMIVFWKFVAFILAVTTVAFGMHNVVVTGFYFAYLTHWGIVFCTLYQIMSLYHSVTRLVCCYFKQSSADSAPESITESEAENAQNRKHSKLRRDSKTSRVGSVICSSADPVLESNKGSADRSTPHESDLDGVEIQGTEDRFHNNAAVDSTSPKNMDHADGIGGDQFSLNESSLYKKKSGFDRGAVADDIITVPMSVKIMWILFELGTHTAAGAALVFWPLVVVKPENYDIQFNLVANHGLVLLVTLFDGMIVNRIPFRIMHWYLFLLPFDVLYMVWTVIHDMSGIGNPDLNDNDPTTNDDALYRNVLEWQTSWPIALTTSCGIVFLLGPTVFVSFWLLSIYPIERIFQLLMSIVSCGRWCRNGGIMVSQIQNNRDLQRKARTTKIAARQLDSGDSYKAACTSSSNASMYTRMNHNEHPSRTRLRYKFNATSK